MTDVATRDGRPPTILESALHHDRTPVVVLLTVLPLVSWLWIVVMSRDMYGPMTGASAWMMTARWDVRHLFLLWAMWTVMMTGMGPVTPLRHVSGKLFATFYALYSGVAFLAIAGLLVAPVAHRLLHRLHLEESEDS